MAMIKRRDFVKLLTLFAVGCSSFGLISKVLVPFRRVNTAERGTEYPGKIVPINQSLLKKPGKWQG
jgi:hypothetical protein